MPGRITRSRGAFRMGHSGVPVAAGRVRRTSDLCLSVARQRRATGGS